MQTQPSELPELLTIAKQMVSPGKGLLAADESIETVAKRFALIGLADTAPSRRAFRDMLLTVKGEGHYISGVILFDETFRDTVHGKSFVEILQEEGILPGIKVDKGLLTTATGEHLTQGLEGLEGRLKDYVGLGAKFCKWRSLFLVGNLHPTEENIRQNIHDMAQYALLCQRSSLVPIVEPEILMDGTHTRESAGQASEKVLTALFKELKRVGVTLPGLILKTSMVLKGKDSLDSETPQDVASATLNVCRKVLPDDLAGVVFLSGGQKDIQATENLQAIHAMGPLPWPVTFSYSRALEEAAVRVWQGKQEHVAAAQKVLLHRAKMNSLASLGKYTSDMEKEMD